MRVLHFCSEFSSLSQTFIYDHVLGLEQRGLDNHVLTFKRLRPDTRPFDKVHVIHPTSRAHPEVLLRRMWAKARGGKGAGAVWAVDQRQMAAALKRIQPDVIHAQFGGVGAKIAPVAKEMGIPLVTTFHGYDATNLPQKAFWRDRLEELWRDSAAVVGVSENICAKLLELGAPERKVLKIANGVSIERFAYQCPLDRFDGRRVEWLFVGRLVEKKGILYLLEAFRLALKQIPSQLEPILNIVGDGDQMGELRRAIARHGLQASVRIHGAQPHSFVRDMMGRCHLHAQHSVTAANGNQEGQPVGLIEAAASGLPLVATRHSGIPEIVVDGKNGYLVEERDVATMAERMARLSSNPELWADFSRWGREHVETNLNLRRQGQVWTELYERVIEEAASLYPVDSRPAEALVAGTPGSAGAVASGR